MDLKEQLKSLSAQDRKESLKQAPAGREGKQA